MEIILFTVACNNLWCVSDDLETLKNLEEKLAQQGMSQSSSVETIPFTVPCNNNTLISLEKEQGISQSSSKEL